MGLDVTPDALAESTAAHAYTEHRLPRHIKLGKPQFKEFVEKGLGV